MKPSEIANAVITELTRRLSLRLRTFRQQPPAEAPEPGQRPRRESKLGSRPGRYHARALAEGRRQYSKLVRRWLRSG